MATSKGTAHVHGIGGTVTGLTVQSYTISKSFANADEVVAEDGEVVAVKYYDERTTLSLEGLTPTGFSAAIGSSLTFEDFAGHITSIEERGEAKGFLRISITGVQYEGISG